ncbi:serine/threonine-protein kinase [Pseudonocardia spinosispora]|uniref:serine/threonine-protein kinase n=1 Tax=Pseudonocardia spinosispora TaxID=103441 RepID=UPI0006843833|nr:serine/threonine-protein kinase [Pseudonocardia spinosispora]
MADRSGADPPGTELAGPADSGTVAATARADSGTVAGAPVDDERTGLAGGQDYSGQDYSDSHDGGSDDGGSREKGSVGGSGSSRTGSRPSRRGTRSTSSGSGRSRLGGGLVDVPAIPRLDPSAALLTDPTVAENKRFCSRCGKAVGRRQGDTPGPAEGTCPHCGSAYSFRPKLSPGDLVEGQYDVLGCLAHGGLGWIYLARDRRVRGRAVVLKGLLDSGDRLAMKAALAELRFLAEVNHPNIVTIHNFAEHPDEDGEPVGYIVMEYVGGVSLKQLVEQLQPEEKQRGRRSGDDWLDPLPVAQAIAYVVEMLPALGHLHAQGLVYCDFKPDNVIQYDRQLKLIDLGAVIRADDMDSAVYGTLGYQAPEVGTEGPSAASDIHTVGRTLAVLALGLPPAIKGKPTQLPEPTEHPVLARHESLHRVLSRATDPDPLRRFASTDEMAEQLTGVLREVLAVETGRPRPGVSTVFGLPRGVFAAGLSAPPDPARVATALAVPQVDVNDPAAGLLATTTTTEPDEVAQLIAAAEKPSLELRLRLVRAHLEAGQPDRAVDRLDALANADTADWRLDWYRGIAALLAEDTGTAIRRFDVVYCTLPGEATPKLALAASAEAAGVDEVAQRYYAVLARTDPSLVDAAFGLARVALRAGLHTEAIAALDGVPNSSSEHITAQLAAARIHLRDSQESPAGPDELYLAEARVRALPLDPATEHDIKADVLASAIRLVRDGRSAPDSRGALWDCAWRERDLRFGLERCLRASARLTDDRSTRIALVDRANAARPRTWW